MKLEKRLIVTSTVSIIIQFILIIFSSYYTYKSHIETQIEFLLSEENKRFEWVIEDKVAYILSTFSTISRIIESDLDSEKSQLDLDSYISGPKRQILYYIIEDTNSPMYSIERKPITNHKNNDEKLYNNIRKKISEKEFDEHLEIVEFKGKLWIELIKKIKEPGNRYSHIALIHPLDFVIEYMNTSHMGKGGWHTLYNNDVLIHHNGSALGGDIPSDKVALKNRILNDSLYKESSFLTLDYIVGWKPGIF